MENQELGITVFVDRNRCLHCHQNPLMMEVFIDKKEMKRNDHVSSGDILSLLAAKDGYVSGAF